MKRANCFLWLLYSPKEGLVGVSPDDILYGNDIAWSLILRLLTLTYEAASLFDRLIHFLKQLHSVKLMRYYNFMKIGRHGIGQMSFTRSLFGRS